MLDILLWVLFLTVVEGGAVSLAVWLWKKIMETNSSLWEALCTTAFIFTLFFAAGGGIMMAASAVLGTMKLFGMYG